MQVIERYSLSFCLGNSIKYILRAGKKYPETSTTFREVQAAKITDLKKAKWYLEREISNLEKERLEKGEF
jgi:Protein of unknwon function (DUF3310)